MLTRLIPGDQEFFPLLDQLAGRVTSASVLLTDLFEHPDQSDPLARLVREDEHAADDLTQAIVLRLGTSFVPPLDATEIYELAHALDRTIDVLEDAAARVEMFHLTEVDAPARELAGIVRRAAAVLETAVAKLGRPNSILDGISEIWRLQEEGDAAYAGAIRALFAGPAEPLDLLKRKEIYDVLAAALAHGQAAAQVLTSIAVKRS